MSACGKDFGITLILLINFHVFQVAQSVIYSFNLLEVIFSMFEKFFLFFFFLSTSIEGYRKLNLFQEER